jgi:adenosylcobinamide kinase/adenosylcobinamide-phosphate guanylyltransferase
MGKMIFILGGARSGKSQFAIKLAKAGTKSVVFVATASFKDREMQKRIKLHRKNRPSHWKTIEEPKNLVSLFKNLPKKFDLIIIDCLTIFISNLLLNGHTDSNIERGINLILKILKKSKFDSILISNEVGLGIVPDNPLARRFRDLAGRINQKVAKASDKAYLVVSGLSVQLK